MLYFLQQDFLFRCIFCNKFYPILIKIPDKPVLERLDWRGNILMLNIIEILSNSPSLVHVEPELL